MTLGHEGLPVKLHWKGNANRSQFYDQIMRNWSRDPAATVFAYQAFFRRFQGMASLFIRARKNTSIFTAFPDKGNNKGSSGVN
jgi:hypothetical protein